MKPRRPSITNIFEVALHQEFEKLQLGEPDKKMRKVIEKASEKVTVEVKRVMRSIRKAEEKQIAAAKRKEKKEKNRVAKGKAGKKKSTAGGQHEMVENIVA